MTQMLLHIISCSNIWLKCCYIKLFVATSDSNVATYNNLCEYITQMLLHIIICSNIWLKCLLHIITYTNIWLKCCYSWFVCSNICHMLWRTNVAIYTSAVKTSDSNVATYNHLYKHMTQMLLHIIICSNIWLKCCYI